MSESVNQISDITVARQYAYSSILRLILIIVNQVVAVVYFTLVIGYLPYVDVAIVGKASIILTIASLLSPGGIFYYSTTEIPKLISDKDLVRAYIISKLILKKGILIGFLIESLIAISFYLVYSLPISYFIIIYASVTLLTVFSYLNQLNLSWLSLKNYTIFSLTRTVISYLIIISLFFIFRNVIVIFIGWLLSTVLLMLPLVYSHPLTTLKKHEALLNYPNNDLEIPSIFHIIRFGLPIYINFVVLLIGVWFDRIFSSLFLIAELFAIYFVMSRIADIVGNMLLSFKSGILSILSFYIGKGEGKAKKASSIIINTFIFAFSGFIIVLAKFSYLIIDIMLGYKYISGAPILAILFIAIFFRSLYRILISIVASFGDIKKIPLVTSLTLLTRFILYVALMYFVMISSINIALVALLSEIIGIILLFLFFKRFLGFDKGSIIKIAAISSLIFLIPVPAKASIIEGLIFSSIFVAIYIILGLVLRALRDIDVYYILKMNMKILNKPLRLLLKLSRYKVDYQPED